MTADRLPPPDIDVTVGISSLLARTCPAAHHWRLHEGILRLDCPDCGLHVAARYTTVGQLA